ncbi:MAG: hypothetical protein LWW86_10455 [Micrococcales bacterium]|nr:hypothetical protein [Micrococcales bacterium]
MPTRPRLRPHLHVLRRGSGELQLGLDPGQGLLLTGLTPGEVDLVESLDGRRSLAQIYRDGARQGLPEQRIAQLLAVLADEAVLAEAPAEAAPGPAEIDMVTLAAAYPRPGVGSDESARRAAGSIVIDGVGEVPGALAAVLRSAGVGSVLAGRYAADAAEALLTDAGQDLAPETPDLVVLVRSAPVGAATAALWRRSGQEHLPVTLAAGQATIGPLVRPGAGPCLECLDHSRVAVDPGWAAVTTQLDPPPARRLGEVVGETSLSAAVVGLAAMTVLARIDGTPPPPGVSFEIGLPWPVVLARQWQPHPACACAGTAAQGTMAG